jgi:hypothetical protein
MDMDNPKNWVQGVFQLRELDEDLNQGEIKRLTKINFLYILILVFIGKSYS